MAAPFSGEDLVKRSLLSSILGLKIKAPRFQHQQPESSRQPVDYDQPCSSRSLQPPPPPLQCPSDERAYHFLQAPDRYAQPYHDSGGDEGRERTLSDHMAESLFLATPDAQFSPPPHQQVSSPQDIYKEIVCECRELELEQAQARDAMPPHAEYQPQLASLQSVPLYGRHHESARHQDYGAPPPQHFSQPATLCPNCHHSVTPSRAVQQTPYPISRQPYAPAPAHFDPQQHNIKALLGAAVGGGGVAGVSLEELVKIVVSAVKDSGVLSGSVRSAEVPPILPPDGGAIKKERMEMPEEILQRKRQQNNEAAARYRKRQREARTMADGEIDTLTRTNLALRRELEDVDREIALLKGRLAISDARRGAGGE